MDKTGILYNVILIRKWLPKIVSEEIEFNMDLTLVARAILNSLKRPLTEALSLKPSLYSLERILSAKGRMKFARAILHSLKRTQDRSFFVRLNLFDHSSDRLKFKFSKTEACPLEQTQWSLERTWAPKYKLAQNCFLFCLKLVLPILINF